MPATSSVLSRGLSPPNRPRARALSTPTSPPSVVPATAVAVSRPAVACSERGTSVPAASSWLCSPACLVARCARPIPRGRSPHRWWFADHVGHGEGEHAGQQAGEQAADQERASGEHVALSGTGSRAGGARRGSTRGWRCPRSGESRPPRRRRSTWRPATADRRRSATAAPGGGENEGRRRRPGRRPRRRLERVGEIRHGASLGFGDPLVMELVSRLGLTRARWLKQWRDRAGFSPNFQILRELLHCIASSSGPATGRVDRAQPAFSVVSTIMRAEHRSRWLGQDRLPSLGGPAAGPADRCRDLSVHGGHPYGRVAFEAFGALVLALAIWSVRDSPAPTWIVIILGVLASVLSIADAINHSPALELASAILHAVFYFYAAGSLMVYMLADRVRHHRRAVRRRCHLHPGRLGVRVRVQRSADRPAGLLHRRGELRTSRGPGWSCCS